MSPKGNRYAPHLKTVKKKDGSKYYYYRMPNGSLEPLGGDLQASVEAANALTVALRCSGSLVDRVLNKANSPTPKYNASNPPMMQVIDEYRENQLREDYERGKLSDDTYQGKLYLLREYEDEIGTITCQQVKTFDLARYLKSRTGHVQQKHIPLLKKLFRYAIAEGYREFNPANELQPKEPEPRKRKRHTWEGLQQVRSLSPLWMQTTIDIALYSLQRRSDLTAMHKDHVSRSNKTLEILQQKTRNYANPIYIEISMGATLWAAVDSALTSEVPCPYLVHCRPRRITAQARASKPHPFAVLPDYLSKQFSKYRDMSGAYAHLSKDERPTLNQIRPLGILMYHKAGYHIDYIMALAGHAKESTTQYYIDGHEERKPVAVNADLSLDQLDVNAIEWDASLLPPEIAKLIDEDDA